MGICLSVRMYVCVFEHSVFVVWSGEKQPQHDDGSGPSADSADQVHPGMHDRWREGGRKGLSQRGTERKQTGTLAGEAEDEKEGS